MKNSEKPLRIAVVNTTDIVGGAARAAYRLHTALRSLGHVSTMVVNEKYSSDDSVHGPRNTVQRLIASAMPSIDHAPLRRIDRQPHTFLSLEWFPNNTARRVREMNPDIVNLHWVGAGFVPIRALPRLNYPLVWTLHDMWPFTGICHYDRGCGRYVDGCGECPQLFSHNRKDLSSRTWQKKARAWSALPITFVAPSAWLAERARNSPLLRDKRVDTIPYGLDLQIYRPIAKAVARQILDLPVDARLIAFDSTSDPRKGGHHFWRAMSGLESNSERGTHIIAFGNHDPSASTTTVPVHYLGQFRDDRSLALVYAAADVFVAPSEDDNLPNTVMEATACGTPCVAFAIGGMPDLIDHERTGYLAQPFDSDDLRQGIAWVTDESRHASLAEMTRAKAEHEFSAELQARRYEKLYKELIYTTK